MRGLNKTLQNQKNTNIMSNKGNALISILILALGGVFIWLYDGDTLPRNIVLLCGLAFVVPAVISLLSQFIARRSDRASAGLRLIQMVCGIGGLGLGLSIILLPDVFRPLLVYPFAALMVGGGAFQVFQLSHGNRPVDYPGWLYVAPILILAAGVVALCLPQFHTVEFEKWVVLMTGIAGVLFGINGLCVSVLSHRLPRRNQARIAEQTTSVKPEAAENMATTTEHPSATHRLDSES